MRKLCWFATSFSAAIFLCIYFLPGSLPLIASGLCAALGCLSCLFFRDHFRRRFIVAALGLTLGFLWTGCYAALFRLPAQTLIEESAQEHTFVVSDFPKETSRGASFCARLQEPEAPLIQVELYAGREALDFRPGDRICGPVRLAPSDFLQGKTVEFYQAKGIFLLGYAQDKLSVSEHPTSIPFRYFPQYVAHTLKTSVAKLFPNDVSGFMIALLTGDKGSLPPGTYISFQRTGISHVIAVSGLHIGFLSGALAFLLGRRSRISAAAGIAVMFFFAAVAGSSPSALRAAVMSSFLLLAPLVQREPDKPTTLSTTLMVLLIPCPYAAASIGLQLSFAAVAGIYLVTGPLNSRWLTALPKCDMPFGKVVHRILEILCCNLALTIGALLFTTPLTALYFGSVSLIGPLTNLLVLWAVSSSFLGGLLSCLLGAFIPAIGSILAWFTAWPARWILFVAHKIARLPFAALSLLSGYLVLWFSVAYFIVLLWLVGWKKIRPLLPTSALLLTLCAALAANAWPVHSNMLTVTALDVGQGASTLLCSKGHAVLVDCGGNSGNDPGDIAADHLQSLGITRLDALILTHYHSDHAGGVPELLSRIQVSLLILPDVTAEEPLRSEILSLAAALGCEVKFLTEDFYHTFGAASLTLFSPLGNGGANEEGLSILCSADTFDVLITGDMTSIVERRLVKYKSLPDIELLLVGHHGAKSSTSEELLLATTPEIAVISSGYNNYGHPAPETLERLGAIGCDIYLTNRMGTITIVYKGE